MATEPFAAPRRRQPPIWALRSLDLRRPGAAVVGKTAQIAAIIALPMPARSAIRRPHARHRHRWRTARPSWAASPPPPATDASPPVVAGANEAIVTAVEGALASVIGSGHRATSVGTCRARYGARPSATPSPARARWPMAVELSGHRLLRRRHCSMLNPVPAAYRSFDNVDASLSNHLSAGMPARSNVQISRCRYDRWAPARSTFCRSTAMIAHA